MLEIARQSVPDGYGNSYFWVKPDRIVPADRVRTVGGRMDFEGHEIRPFDEAGGRGGALVQDQASPPSPSASCTPTPTTPTSWRCARSCAASTGCHRPISSEVLREYREYERSMTTLVDAAVKPNVSRYVSNIHERLTPTSATPTARSRFTS